MKIRFNKKVLVWFIPVLSLIAGGALGFFTSQRPVIKTDIPTSTTQANQDSNQNQQAPAAQTNITVSQPVADQTVGDTFSVRGKARVFENVISLRVKNAGTGVVYIQTTTMATGSAGTFSDYNYNADLSKLKTKPKSGDVLSLELFQASAKDGSEIDKVSFNLIYRPTEASMQVLVYLPKNDKSEFSCDLVYPVKRTITKRTDVAAAALEQLIAGPTAADLANGYLTSIPSGTKLLGVSIKDGTAYANFNSRIEEGKNSSCHIVSIRNQITETLKQFSTIKEVVIQENGSAAGVLMP